MLKRTYTHHKSSPKIVFKAHYRQACAQIGSDPLNHGNTLKANQASNQFGCDVRGWRCIVAFTNRRAR
uniref:Uncharacterized protein n=1 Tax=Arundo donax TaxID=35708 RepID=A0A0A9G6N5_ARUDO